jgi:DNA modification methylase
VCSPPYWGLRDYGVDGQLGLEATPDEYVTRLVEVFREVRRVLAEDGTLWLNLGDSYARPKSKGVKFQGGNDGVTDRQAEEGLRGGGLGGLKEKDLCMIPSRVALALQEDGWWVRSRIVWHKESCMPESVTDRPTSSHEYIFLLAKSKRYYYDHEAVKEDAAKSTVQDSRLDEPVERDIDEASERYGGDTSASRRNAGSYFSNDETRNKRDVWTVNPKPFPDAHFAVYPPELITPCVEAGSEEGDTVLDPFAGAGTTGLVALAKGRDFTGIDLNREYVEMAADRIRDDSPMFNEVQINEPAVQ